MQKSDCNIGSIYKASVSAMQKTLLVLCLLAQHSYASTIIRYRIGAYMYDFQCKRNQAPCGDGNYCGADTYRPCTSDDTSCQCRTCEAEYNLYGKYKFPAYNSGWGRCGHLLEPYWPWISSIFKSCPAGHTSPDNNMGCVPCSAGKYGAAGTSLCVDCEPGKSQAQTGADKCGVCEAGKIQPLSGAAQCVSCADGQLSCQDSVQCLDVCPAGTYKVLGVPQCMYCPRGKNTDKSGQASCYDCAYVAGACVEKCPAGYRMVADRICEECPSGKYAAQPAATACSSCLPGQYAKPGATNCTTCLPGTYVDGFKCSTCPNGKYSCNSGCVDEPIYIPNFKTDSSYYPQCAPCDAAFPDGDCFRGDEPGRRKEYRQNCSTTSAGSCVPCSDRTPCPAGKQWECRANKVGCFACAAGKYKAVAAAPECADCDAQCPAGMFAKNCSGENAGTCTICAPEFCGAGQYYDCQEETCRSCIEGRIAGSAARCPQGQYVAGCGGTDAGACAACPLCYGRREGCEGASPGTRLRL